MANRVSFAVSATPIETLTDANNGTHDVLAGEVNKILGGSGEVEITGYGEVVGVQGFADGAVGYLHASRTTTLTSPGALTGTDFLYFKNTGYLYSDATTLGAVTTNCVLVCVRIRASDTGVDGYTNEAGSGAEKYIEIAWLQPGQAIVLPLGCRTHSVTNVNGTGASLLTLADDTNGSNGPICLQTRQADGTSVSSGNGNAVEFLAVT